MNAGYVMVGMEGLSLLVDQQSIVSIETRTSESTAKNTTVNAAHNVVQEINAGGAFEGCPVFTVDATLTPLAEVPESRRYTVILRVGEGAYALTADNVRPLPGAQLERATLPRVMTREPSPIHEYSRIDDKLAFFCDPGMLWNYLSTSEPGHGR